MNTKTLRNLDLNLLHVFSVLMEEKSVSKAAERLFIGQPGLSGALRRLREALDDELFVRVGRGLQPTPRALAIAPDIARALSTIERAVRAPDVFDPAAWEGELRIGMCDNFEVAFLGPLTARIRELAPRSCVLAVASTKRDSVQLLEQGAYDVSVSVHENPPSWHLCDPLFQQRLVCLYDPRQLNLTSPLSINDYAKAQHVIVSSEGDGATNLDSVLSAAGVRRDIVAGVSRHASIAPLLLSVPAIATVPEITAYCLAPLYGLQVTASPLELPLEQISMLYRRTDQMDGRSIWFRNIVKDVISTTLASRAMQDARV
ncbi:LysR family transcriptional regulator [Pseudomonas sp. PB120]|uniref:LysR family transcriptional regulator n=1 Tax=Pseudomonas sp. PB120 TaxID=2494700 RepID=UPI0012FE332D|nr:LysR family transcriptional regulator [Pseudomonas sp. PB120]MVV48435.1 LysR family transcriptional regulator [Pseudomonas sp. PB120]